MLFIVKIEGIFEEVEVLNGDLEDYFLLSSLIRAFLPARSRR